MFQLNTVIGRITQPEIKSSQKGNTVLTFGVAVSESKDHTEWYNCTIVGSFADTMKTKLAKGQTVFVTLKQKSNKGNDGKTYITHWVQDLRIVGSSSSAPTNNAGSTDDDCPF